jgi:peptidoglycan/LPS O-acetylase OafA/YrhL
MIERISFRNDIQILRGIAVISVILFHLDKNIFKFGYLGVDIFFVISGFVISNLVYSKLADKTFSLSNFFFMRFKRIVPALMSYLLFVQILLYFNVDHQNVIQNTKTSLYSLLFLANVHISQYLEYFNDDSSKNLVINLWSLSVEEQFYFVFPFVAIFFSKYKYKKQLILYSLLIFSSFFSMTYNFYDNVNFLKDIFLNYQNYLFYSPFTRVWEFILGVLAMFLNNLYLENKLITNLKKFGSILFLFLIATIYLDFIHINVLLRMGVANFITFMILIVNIQFKFKRNLFIFFLIFSGNISYSLYLFHQGILSGIRNHNKFTTTDSSLYIDLKEPSFLIVIILAIYLISYLNYLLIENKYRKIQSFSFNSFKMFFILSFLTITFSLIALNTNGYSFRHTDLKSFNQQNSNIQYLNGTNYLTQDGSQCLNRTNLNSFCAFESKKSTKKIYIVGDSMISSLVGGFLDKSVQSEYNIIEVTKGGCPLLLNTCDFYKGSQRYNSLTEIENSVFILGGRYQKQINLHSEKPTLENNLKETIQLLTKKKNRVYLVSPLPEPGINERMYYFKNNKYLNHDYNQWKASIFEFEQMTNKIDTDNFTVINLEYLFCNNEICNFKTDEHYYFLDHVHFTYFGSKYVATEIIKLIDEN